MKHTVTLILSCACFAVIGACASRGAIGTEPLEGILTVLNGDPSSGRGAQRIYLLNADDGRRFELDVSQAGRSMIGLDGKRIRARPEEAWPSSPSTNAPRVRVLDIEVIDTAPRR